MSAATESDVRRLLRGASALPFGRPRTELVEQAVELAARLDDPGLLTETRLLLHEAYQFGGEQKKSLVPFSQVLRDYDAGTHRFDPWLVDKVLWQSKWAAGTLIRYARIPLDQIETLLAQMETRARAAGHGIQAVARARVNLTRHVHGAAAAEEGFRRWRTLPRDATSDCLACEKPFTAELLYVLGDDEAGLAESASVRAGDLTCRRQPHWALSEALLPLVRTGRLAEAAEHHRRGIDLVRSVPHLEGALADHLEFLARTGNEARGLELLQSEVAALDSGIYQLDAAAARLLTAVVERVGDGVVVTLSDGEEVPAEELARRCADYARSSARRFDERNGTTTVSDEVEGVLAAPPLPYVPLT